MEVLRVIFFVKLHRNLKLALVEMQHDINFYSKHLCKITFLNKGELTS